MITKTANQAFVLSNGDYQVFPNFTNDDGADIVFISEYTQPKETNSQSLQIEYQWAKSEINSVTEQLEKHADNSSRAIATEQEWRDYREALRDYATVDSDGVYSLRTEKPVRPS